MMSALQQCRDQPADISFFGALPTATPALVERQDAPAEVFRRLGVGRWYGYLYHTVDTAFTLVAQLVTTETLVSANDSRTNCTNAAGPITEMPEVSLFRTCAPFRMTVAGQHRKKDSRSRPQVRAIPLVPPPYRKDL